MKQKKNVKPMVLASLALFIFSKALSRMEDVRHGGCEAMKWK